MSIENIDFVVCKICGECKRVLTQHLRLIHNITTEEYKKIYDNFISCKDAINKQILSYRNPQKTHKCENPLCENQIPRRKTYCNNKCCRFDPKYIENVKNTNIKTYQISKENNKIKPIWNKGLTKETDKRLKMIGEKSNKQNNPEKGIKISKILLELYKNGLPIHHLEAIKKANKKTGEKYKSGELIHFSKKENANEIFKKIANSNRGKKRNGIARENIRKAAKNPERNKKIIQAKTGKKITGIALENIRRANKNLDKIRRCAEGLAKYKALHKNKYNRSHSTKPERKFREILDKNNINYIFQKNISRYVYDFLINGNLILEVDGRTWHIDNLNNLKFDDKMFHIKWKSFFNDFQKEITAFQYEYELKRIWEDEITEEKVLELING